MTDSIERIDFERLRHIGLSPAIVPTLMAQLAAVPPLGADRMRVMRVVEVQRDHVRLHDGTATHEARVLAALLRSLREREDALAVGDWVLADPDLLGSCWVVARVPPLTQLARRGAGSDDRQVIASNVDTALLVMGQDHDHNLRRLERYLALVRTAGVGAVVVLTKADLGIDVAGRLAQVRSFLRPSEHTLAVNALDTATADALRPWLGHGRTLVLLGSSGAGKSTLTNTLMRRRVQDTGEVRADDSRGRHTTTVRSLHHTPDGACIIDTPGLRTLRLDADEATLHDAYDDIARLALQCRFRDCRHLDEPGCAVREALPGERLRQYHKLMREARRDTLTVLDRRAQLQQWKSRAQAGRERLRAKRS